MAKVVERAHALLSASSVHKWEHCPPSARLEYDLPDSTSTAADEGTLAHAMCELKLQKVFTDQNMATRTYNSRMKKLTENELYDPEMDRYTDEYVDYIKEVAFQMPSVPLVVIEKKYSYDSIAKDGFGTSDCTIIQGNQMHIIDFKYGKGIPVRAEDNGQLKLYALGALNEYGFLYPIQNVTLHIIQPRLRSFTHWQISTADLRAWGEYLKPIAALAYEGDGDFKQGTWCTDCFCKIAGTCRCRAEENLKVMDDAADPISGAPKKPETLSNDEVGAILKKAQFLKSWVTKLEKYAQDQLMQGIEIPGWKLVEGRSNREFSDVDAALKSIIEAGIDKALLYNTAPLSLIEIEKVVTPEIWKTITENYVVKPQGKPAMVPADDKRPEFKVKPSAEDAFGGDNAYKEEK